MFRKKEGKMTLKNPKKRKILRFKYIFYLLIMYLGFAYTFYENMKDNQKINNKEFITFLVQGGNINNLSNFKLTNLVNKTMNLFLNIDLTNPKTILNTTILSQNKTKKTIALEQTDDYSNYQELKDISKYIEDPNPIDINNPIVYLYSTHQLENYNNKNLDIYGITPNVLMASYILKEKLNKQGIVTIVEDTNISEFLTINNWDYSSSYKATRLLIMDKKSKYNSLKYFIDIHRDSVNKKISTIKIKDKSYAKILFVVGLEHDNYNNNLTLANNINELFNKYYPNLSRGVLKKEGHTVDGVYNQDLSSNSMLIEVGGVENNIEEVFNTIEAISIVLKKYIEGDLNE